VLTAPRPDGRGADDWDSGDDSAQRSVLALGCCCTSSPRVRPFGETETAADEASGCWRFCRPAAKAQWRISARLRKSLRDDGDRSGLALPTSQWRSLRPSRRGQMTGRGAEAARSAFDGWRRRFNRELTVGGPRRPPGANGLEPIAWRSLAIDTVKARTNCIGSGAVTATRILATCVARLSASKC